MRLLVTGGAGSVGSAVVPLAISHGYEVINADPLAYAACLDNVARATESPRHKFKLVDLCNQLELDRIFSKRRPDTAVYLAVESNVDRSIDRPPNLIETNIPDTFLKAASNHHARARHATYGPPVILTDYPNNFGSFHFPEKLIPLVMLNARLLTLENGEIRLNYNIAGENERSNLDLVKPLCAVIDWKRPPKTDSCEDQITFVPDRPDHGSRFAIAPAGSSYELGWRLCLTIAERLDRTMQGHLDNEEWWREPRNREGIERRFGEVV